jgi:WbqC-like protein family
MPRARLSRTAPEHPGGARVRHRLYIDTACGATASSGYGNVVISAGTRVGVDFGRVELVNNGNNCTVRICIIQSCYIPWKGFFDLIGRCDEYVIYDSAQYVKRHWHNRNRIKTANGVEWLTIPVLTTGRYEQPIDQVEIEKPWADKHWRALELAYKHAPFFEQFAPAVKEWYERAGKEARLTDVNAIFLHGIANLFRLKTRIVRDTAYPAAGTRTERLLGIAQAAGANRYLSGPSARDYFDEEVFTRAGITPEWMSYAGYPEYPQLHGAFEHAVTALDLLFNVGPDRADYRIRPT